MDPPISPRESSFSLSLVLPSPPSLPLFHSLFLSSLSAHLLSSSGLDFSSAGIGLEPFPGTVITWILTRIAAKDIPEAEYRTRGGHFF